mgnify:CR=1 FL=1
MSKLEYTNIMPVGRAIDKDMSRINRGIRDSDKVRAKMKEGVNLSNKEIERVLRIADIEEESGVNEYCRCYKGNRLHTVNKFLYDTSLQPKERICYRYVAIPTECKGRLRNRAEVRVTYKTKQDTAMLKDFKPYVLYMNDKKVGEHKNQLKVIEHIKKIIGWKYD